MTIVEFECHWAGNYNKEQETTYPVLYGDDRSLWPETNDITSVFIDIDKIIRFNPHADENKTTVELHGGYCYSLVIKLDDFLCLLKHFGISIYNSKPFM